MFLFQFSQIMLMSVIAVFLQLLINGNMLHFLRIFQIGPNINLCDPAIIISLNDQRTITQKLHQPSIPYEDDMPTFWFARRRLHFSGIIQSYMNTIYKIYDTYRSSVGNDN